MRNRLPGAVQLVFDHYNALAIGFGTSERASEEIFSIALFPRWIRLFFFEGGDSVERRRARQIVLRDARALYDPAVQMLMTQAMKNAAVPIDSNCSSRLVIEFISEKQRPRLPAK